jgi:hypothetical protein
VSRRIGSVEDVLNVVADVLGSPCTAESLWTPEDYTLHVDVWRPLGWWNRRNRRKRCVLAVVHALRMELPAHIVLTVGWRKS